MHENPSLEKRKEEIQESITSNNRILRNLKENILQILNNSQVPLTENKELYEALKVSKQTTSHITDILNRASLTKMDINTSREIYKSCAARASLLFFIIDDLKYINAAYRFSLNWYINILQKSLEKSGKDQNIEERKTKIINYHTYNLFRNVCLALSLPDRTILAFHICIRVSIEADILNTREVMFYLYGAGSIERHEQVENPNTDWINTTQWDNITELDKLPGFRGIIQSFEENNGIWRSWCLSDKPEDEILPENWERNLTLFQKYILIRCIRMDRLEPCMKKFVIINIGKKFIDIELTLNDLLKTSDPATPILLISDGNTDHMCEVRSLSELNNQSIKHIDMSTESIENAVKFLKDCVKHETWLYIDGCLQSTPWLSKINHIQQYLNTINPKSDFRLWITLKNNIKAFPVDILQNSLKYMCNRPMGIKHHMKQIFDHTGNEVFRKIESSKHPFIQKTLIFALCFFHALLTERHKYHELGWNMPYIFTNTDFKLAAQLLISHLEKIMAPNPTDKDQGVKTSHCDRGNTLLWSFIKNVILQIGYGTYFVNIWDQRIFDVYSSGIFRNELIQQPLCTLVPNVMSYQIPRDGKLTSYLNIIENQLPQEDSTDAFGLNNNADIQYLKSCSAYSLQMLCQMDQKLEINITDPRNKSFNLIKIKKIILELLASIPIHLNLEHASKILAANKTPVNTCLINEMHQYNVLLQLITRDLETMLTALSGEIHINSEMSIFLEDIKYNRIPKAWITLPCSSILPEKHLSDWAIDLKHRVNYLRKWSETGQLSTDVTLGLFLKPKLFMQSVMRMYAESNNVSLDDLEWDVSVLPSSKHLNRISIENGFIGKGFYLYNGSWDMQNQCLMKPKTLQLFNSMPPILFKPKRKRDIENKTVYYCPCFYSMQKKPGSLLMEIGLCCNRYEKEVWVKMNTCMLLNI